MKIALVTTSFFPRVGGAELVVHNLAQEWSRKGHEVCVLAANSKGDYSDLGYSVEKYWTPRSYLRIAPHRWPFCRYISSDIQKRLERIGADFISGHFGYPAGVWLSRIDPLPRFLVTCHGRELTKFDWGYRQKYNIDRILADALNKSAGAVAISSYARKLMEEIGVKKEIILDIPNGVDVNRFQKKSNFDLRSSFRIDKHAMVILSVGRNHAQKAYEDGIKAFAGMAAQMPDIRYLILGREATELAPMTEELHIRDKVILCNGLSGEDLVGAYQQADIFFSPSVWEMMPLVALEAIASGLPCVLTNVSGSQDLVVDGVNGYLVEPGEIADMTKRLLTVAQDKQLRERMSAYNLENSRNYSWDRISEKYLENR